MSAQPRRPVEPAVVGPSGVYGFREVEPCSWETGRVVQIVERTNGVSWIPTPARYYAKDIVRWGDRAGLAIDSGQGWYLPDEDVVPWVAFARTVLADEPCVNCGQQLADHDRNQVRACETEHHAHLLGLNPEENP